MVVSAQQVAHADATTGKFALHLAHGNGFNLPNAFAGQGLAAFLGGLVIAQGGAGVGRRRGGCVCHGGYRGEWCQHTVACFRKSVTNCCNFVRWWAVFRWRKRTFERTVTETSCIILQPVLVEAMALLVLQITASFQRCFLLLLINPTAHVHDNFIFFVYFPCFNP